MPNEKYGVKEYLEEYEQILNEKPVPSGTPAGQKPNVMEMLKAKNQLGKVGNERIKS